MSAVTVDLARLDTHISRTEAAARQATASIRPGYVLLYKGLYNIWKIHRGILRIRGQVAKLTIESPEDRKKAHDIATTLGQIAHRLEEIVPELKALTPPLAGRLLEDAICQAEDTAETLALSASEEFADLVDRTLAEVHSGA